MKPWNPMLTKPSTPSTRAANVSGRFLLKTATAIDQRRKRERPQQQRAFVRAPHRGEAVERRQRRVGVVRDVQDREVVLVERPGQHARTTARRTPTARPPQGAPPPSSVGCRSPVRRGRRRPARRTAAARGSAQTNQVRRPCGGCSDAGLVVGGDQVLPGRRGGRASAAACCRVQVRLQAVLRLRAACSSRRAWPGPLRRRSGCRPSCRAQ